MAKSVKEIIAKLAAAGVTEADYFIAVSIFDAGGQRGAVKKARALNKKRVKAAERLHKVLDDTIAAFQGPSPFVDERGLAVLRRIREEVAKLRTSRRRSSVEAIVRSIERNTPLNARHMGELALLLSEKGISFSDQAKLQLTPIAGHPKPLRANRTVEQLASQLKTQAWRARPRTALQEDEELIARVFPEQVTSRRSSRSRKQRA